MRESNGASSAEKKSIGLLRGDGTGGDSESKANANISTDISPEKGGNAGAGSNGGANATDDISPEGLLEVISQEWKNELERIRQLGLNGYKRRKESRNECLV